MAPVKGQCLSADLRLSGVKWNVCPYRALISLSAIKSRLKFRRNDNCIDCQKCEEACPTHEAGRADWKQECYMGWAADV